jgi:hypothetical protein
MNKRDKGAENRRQGTGRSRLRYSKASLFIAISLTALLFSSFANAQTPAASSSQPAWQPPAVEEIKSQSLSWLEEKKAGDASKAKAAEIWASLPSSPGEEEVLDRLAEIFALEDENARRLTELCSAPRTMLILPSQTWLTDANAPRFEICNLRLYYACWLARELLYEEARDQLMGLQPSEVAAPSMLLFYESVVCHKLLERDSGMKALDQLLQGPPSSPRRYRTVAKMMQADLKDLEEDSLDHIARRMDDIHRRLDLGRAGPKVRKIEDGVIESLDKLIKKKEEEQQQQEQDQQEGGNRLRSNKPAQESKLMGGKGPGDVVKRNIGSKSGWGDLPPKEREEALQQIGRDLPANYRDVVEQYFKRLASEGSE